jgi:hypothetical protein
MPGTCVMHSFHDTFLTLIYPPYASILTFLSSLCLSARLMHSFLTPPYPPYALIPYLCTCSSLILHPTLLNSFPRGCLQSTANPLLLGCNSSIIVVGAITRYHTRFTRALASPWQARECLSCLVFLRVIMRFSDASRYVGCARA